MKKEIIIINGETAVSTAIKAIKKGGRELDQIKRELDELVTPATIKGRGITLLKQYIPQLGQHLQINIAEEMRARLADSILTLHTHFKTIAKELKLKVDEYDTLNNALGDVESDPTLENIETLRDLLRSKVEQALNLHWDSETQELADEIRNMDPNREETERKALIAEANQLLSLMEPMNLASRHILITLVQLIESQKGTYGISLAMGELSQLNYDAAQDMIKAAGLKTDQLKVFRGQVEFAIRAADLSLQIFELNSQAAATVNPSELARLSSQAQKLLASPQEN